MAIIGILAGMVITYAWQARLKAVQTACLNNIRQAEFGGGGHYGRELGGGSLTCLLDATYAHNQYATSERQVSDLTGTVMAFETHDVAVGTEADVWPLHQGGSNYVFWDGHARWSKTIPNFCP